VSEKGEKREAETKQVSVRVTPQQYDQIGVLCRRIGVTRTQYLKQMIREEIQRHGLA